MFQKEQVMSNFIKKYRQVRSKNHDRTNSIIFDLRLIFRASSRTYRWIDWSTIMNLERHAIVDLIRDRVHTTVISQTSESGIVDVEGISLSTITRIRLSKMTIVYPMRNHYHHQLEIPSQNDPHEVPQNRILSSILIIKHLAQDNSLLILSLHHTLLHFLLIYYTYQGTLLVKVMVTSNRATIYQYKRYTTRWISISSKSKRF